MSHFNYTNTKKKKASDWLSNCIILLIFIFTTKKHLFNMLLLFIMTVVTTENSQDLAVFSREKSCLLCFHSHNYLVLTILGRAGSAVASLSWPARSIWLVPLLTGNATVDKDRTDIKGLLDSSVCVCVCYLPVFQESG